MSRQFLTRLSPLWYSLTAPVYDLTAGDRSYALMRDEAISQSRLQQGHVVLDLACGTGLNFAALLDAIGPEGHIIGVDASQAMLRRARQRIVRQRWDATRFHLMDVDAKTLNANNIAAVIGKEAHIDCLFCSFGLSVIPDWEDVFASVFGLVKPGGRCTLMDLYYSRVSITARLVNILSFADCSRRVWEPLRALSDDYTERTWDHVGGQVVVASGTKPE